MIYAVAGLVALTVVLIVVVGAELVARRSGSATLQRLAELEGADRDAGADRRSRLEERGREAFGTLGERILSRRRKADALRQQLAQAGYRAPSAASAFLAARALLMLGIGALTVVLLPLVGASPALAIFALPYVVGIGWFAPRFWLARRVTARRRSLERALPDTLDLLVVCVEAGLGLNQAIVRVAQEIEHLSEAMSAELRLTNLEIRAGTPRDEALRNLGTRTGVEDLQSLTAMLVQADRFGTSIAQALRVYAESLRTRRRQRAEEAAAKTTIKLVFPLVLFIFPALFVVLLGPAILMMVRQLGNVK